MLHTRLADWQTNIDKKKAFTTWTNLYAQLYFAEREYEWKANLPKCLRLNWSSCNELAGVDYAYKALIVSSTIFDKFVALVLVACYSELWDKYSAFSVRCSFGPTEAYARRIDHSQIHRKFQVKIELDEKKNEIYQQRDRSILTVHICWKYRT